jgi:putative ATP-binding cassette transporter
MRTSRALDYVQSDRGASFRTDLVQVRENAESIALLRREGRLGARQASRLDALLANARRIIAVNRQLRFPPRAAHLHPGTGVPPVP